VTHDEATQGSEFELGSKSGDCVLVFDRDLKGHLGGPPEGRRVGRVLEKAEAEACDQQEISLRIEKWGEERGMSYRWSFLRN
jgi:hypothetical protein